MNGSPWFKTYLNNRMITENKNTKILIICPFPRDVAAGQRLKYEQYIKKWEEDGYDIDISPFMDNNLWNIVYKNGYHQKKILGVIKGYLRRVFDIIRLKNYDIVYIFMWVTPFGSFGFEKIYRMLSKKFIYDIEDNILEVANSSANPITRFLKNPNKIKFLIKESNHVISSSPELNSKCQSINLLSKATYISASFNPARYIPCNQYSNNKKIVIGWTGTFSSIQYLNLLKDVFYDLNKICDFKLRIIGNFEYYLPGIDLEVVQWNRASEIEDLQQIDIGLYPLDISDWVGGKSGLKAIQYMALGIPTVATGVGNTLEVIEHMKDGWLVKTNEEWLLALKTLISDAKLRKELGISGREKALKKFSTDTINQEYLNIFQELL